MKLYKLHWSGFSRIFRLFFLYCFLWAKFNTFLTFSAFFFVNNGGIIARLFNCPCRTHPDRRARMVLRALCFLNYYLHIITLNHNKNYTPSGYIFYYKPLPGLLQWQSKLSPFKKASALKLPVLAYRRPAAELFALPRLCSAQVSSVARCC